MENWKIESNIREAKRVQNSANIKLSEVSAPWSQREIRAFIETKKRHAWISLCV